MGASEPPPPGGPPAPAGTPPPGGMSRGVANGRPEPALELMTSPWAAGVVQRALISEQHGHQVNRLWGWVEVPWLPILPR